MRNRKVSYNVLFKNKRSGEFISSKRFNNHNYILTSIFDDERDEVDFDNQLNESIFDDYDEDDFIDDDADDYSNTYDSYTTDGNTTHVTLDGNKVQNAVFLSMADMLRFHPDCRDINVTDFVVFNGSDMCCTILYDEITFYGSIITFIVNKPNNKNIGTLDIKFNDMTCSEVSYSIKPSVRAGYLGNLSKNVVISYDDFKRINKRIGLLAKSAKQFYSSVLSGLVDKFVENGMSITLASVKPGRVVNYNDFKERSVDNSFMLDYLKPICAYSQDKPGNRDVLLSELSKSMSKIKGYYNEDANTFDSVDFLDDNYVIIGKATKFTKRFVNSGWCLNNNILPESNFVYMRWQKVVGIKVNAFEALAMPAATFIAYASIFYIFLLNLNLK